MTIFEKIAAGEIPAYKIWENDTCMAFLDINPVHPGQTLVVPKKNWGDYIFNLSPDQYQDLLNTAKEVAKLLESKITCERVVMWVEGFEVPHVHVKLLPVQSPENFHVPGATAASQEDLKKMYEKITH